MHEKDKTKAVVLGFGCDDIGNARRPDPCCQIIVWGRWIVAIVVLCLILPCDIVVEAAVGIMGAQQQIEPVVGAPETLSMDTIPQGNHP